MRLKRKTVAVGDALEDALVVVVELVPMVAQTPVQEVALAHVREDAHILVPMVALEAVEDGNKNISPIKSIINRFNGRGLLIGL